MSVPGILLTGNRVLVVNVAQKERQKTGGNAKEGKRMFLSEMRGTIVCETCIWAGPLKDMQKSFCLCKPGEKTPLVDPENGFCPEGRWVVFATDPKTGESLGEIVVNYEEARINYWRLRMDSFPCEDYKYDEEVGDLVKDAQEARARLWEENMKKEHALDDQIPKTSES